MALWNRSQVIRGFVMYAICAGAGMFTSLFMVPKAARIGGDDGAVQHVSTSNEDSACQVRFIWAFAHHNHELVLSYMQQQLQGIAAYVFADIRRNVRGMIA